jgi:hypothetical protein
MQRHKATFRKCVLKGGLLLYFSLADHHVLAAEMFVYTTLFIKLITQIPVYPIPFSNVRICIRLHR